MKKFLNILGVLISIVMVVVIFAIEILFGVNYTLNKSINKEKLKEVIANLTNSDETDKVVQEINTADLENIKIPEGKTYTKSDINKKVYEYFEENGLTREEAKEVINDESFKNMVDEYVSSVVMNSIDGSDIVYPDKKELTAFVEKKYDVLKKLKYFKDKDENADIETIVSETYEEVKIELETVAAEVKIPESKALNIVKKIMNIKPIYFILSLLGSILILMAVCGSFYKWLFWFGLPTFITGISFLTLRFLIFKLIGLAKLDDYLDSVTSIINSARSSLMLVGIVLTALGLICLISVHFLKEKFNKKEDIKA